MFLNQRGFGDVEINNSSTFQNDKILLNHNTTILSNLQVSGLFFVFVYFRYSRF